MKSDAKTALEYHNRTKHFPGRLARSPGYMDWQAQPNPFRHFEGAETFQLGLDLPDPVTQYKNLYDRQRNAIRPFDKRYIGKFLELSLGLSAWKSYEGDSWSLRMNPSSGNLHAEEAYLLLPSITGLGGRAGVFHYNPHNHTVEKRADIDDRLWESLANHIGGKGFFIALSTIYWREAWKYGERAFRYCNLDTGHAVACLSYSASVMGWEATCLSSVTGRELSSLLGYDRTEWHPGEKEESELLLFIHGPLVNKPALDLPAGILKQFALLSFKGRPNVLSGAHHDWEIINEVSAATRRVAAKTKALKKQSRAPYLETARPNVQAAAIIRQRRSGQRYDGKTGLSAEKFYAILDRTVPREKCAPFDVDIGVSSIHLLLFVHRVESLRKGLYFLCRNEDDIEDFKRKCNGDFLWAGVDGSPDSLPLYFLQEGNLETASSIISCRQDIAGDGAFSVGMIARFRDNLVADPHSYRRLYWEAGLAGQVLYLEAEAHGLRGTGIGCYFDDMVHELLSLGDDSYQDMYHFTIGKAVEDTRLTTLPPYHHLAG